MKSDIYNELLEFDKTHPSFGRRIIVGRTGSGKTALLKQLVRDQTIKDNDEIEAETTIFEHINNNVFISDLVREGVDLRAFYKSLWMHVLLVKVIKLLYKDVDGFFESIGNAFHGKRRGSLQKAREYVDLHSENFFNSEIVTEITNRFSNELSGCVKLGVVGGSSEAADENVKKIQSTTTSYVSSELLVKQKELIRFICDDADDVTQKRIIISVDDLDKSWLSQSNVRYDFINALLETFKEFINVRSVKILISIRSDILQGVYNHNLRQEEKDSSFISAIEWQRHEIREILDRRIEALIRKQYEARATVSFSDIFNFQVNGQLADEFILDRTMLRPRDAIDFVNLCLSNADGKVALTEGDVLEAEQGYYHSRKKALSDEWRSIYGFIDDYINSISLIRNQSFTVDSLQETGCAESIIDFLIDKTGHAKDLEIEKIAMDIYEIIKLWFRIGVIGYKVGTRLIYSSYRQPQLDITDFAKEFVIHPLFYRY
ncbi:P-loop ATPase, Sll1717 family [Oligella urethralis]|uniref:P-loop ATPase, Sll1717 family n=1 Tax=Oligella urethralis TaxID=90245 RepID=UPI001CEE012F|nr:P-loop NTPase fold protein [Oligella urethralis]